VPYDSKRPKAKLPPQPQDLFDELGTELIRHRVPRTSLAGSEGGLPTPGPCPVPRVVRVPGDSKEPTRLGNILRLLGMGKDE
jgi:hypothetical protein